jgi:HAD superfamily hydrolase (TIGR01509 family)
VRAQTETIRENPTVASPSTPDLRPRPSFLFDLDGTLIDSVYQHVIAWREALQEVGINLAVWKIHRRIGMSGGLFVAALARELETELDPATLARLPQLHNEGFLRRYDSVRPLPGAVELLRTLTEHDVPWAIATSGAEQYARRSLELLELPQDVPLVTREQVRYAKPDPDLFLTAAQRIGVDIEHSLVVGDSVWDLLAARRARALGIGLLSGGYGREELIYAGAFRVYDDPLDLLAHLDEVGARRPA